MKISNSVHVKVSSGENVCVIPFISSGFWSQFVSLRSISSSFHFHDFFCTVSSGVNCDSTYSNSVFTGLSITFWTFGSLERCHYLSSNSEDEIGSDSMYCEL